MLPVRKSESVAGFFLGIDLLHCRAHGPPLKIVIVEGLFLASKRAQGLYLNISVPIPLIIIIIFLSFDCRGFGPYLQALVVKTLGSAIHLINHYPEDKYKGNQ